MIARCNLFCTARLLGDLMSVHSETTRSARPGPVFDQLRSRSFVILRTAAWPVACNDAGHRCGRSAAVVLGVERGPVAEAARHRTAWGELMSLGQHVMIRLVDDRVIAPDAATRRRLSRLIYRNAGANLLVFGCADTHVHFEYWGDSASAGESVRRLKIGLSSALALPPFAPTRFKAIEDQAHLYATFRYVLKQLRRHELEEDMFGDGSSLIDLLGLRVLGGEARARVAALLPRIRRPELLTLLDAPELDLPNPQLHQLAEAAMAAAALARIDGRSRAEIAARRAALAVADAGACSTRDAAELLGVSTRTMLRARSSPLDRALAAAIHRQLNWRAAITPRDRLSLSVMSPMTAPLGP